MFGCLGLHSNAHPVESVIIFLMPYLEAKVWLLMLFAWMVRLQENRNELPYCKPNKVFTSKKNSLLHLAAENGQEDFAHALLWAGWDPLKQNAGKQKN